MAMMLAAAPMGFSAPLRAPVVQMFSEGDIGVLPPLGVYDPLGLIETRDMARYEIMEIKHGRAAMLGFLHVISVEAGAKIPTEECLAAPTGLLASLESMPTYGWLQIMLFCCMQETGAGALTSRREPRAAHVRADAAACVRVPPRAMSTPARQTRRPHFAHAC